MSSRFAFRRALTGAVLTSALLAPAFAARAADSNIESASVQNAYRGKNLNFVVALAAGGGYDQYARTIARHIDRYIPGAPNVVVQNMTGAAGMKATNWLYSIAPRDGLTIGTTQRSVLVEPLYGTKEAAFDPTKFSWLASLNQDVFIAATWKGSGLDSIEDAKAREFHVAADGPASDDYVWPAVLNSVIGTKFKVVAGYNGKAEQRLATKRGEVAGLIGWSWAALQSTEWADYQAGNWRVISFLGQGKHPDFDAPSIYEHAKTQDAKDVLDFLTGTLILGRPVFAPPEIPKDREAALRAAFDKVLKDPAFLAETEKQKLEISPDTGAVLAERVAKLYQTPAAIVDRVQAARKQAADSQRASLK